MEHGLPGHGWTLKKLKRWVEDKLGQSVSRNTLRTILRQASLSWKKCKKLLAKANAEKRALFVAQFQALYQRMLQGEVLIVYVDEAHIHQDLDIGYTWSQSGEPAWRMSNSPGLSKRINWYGAYDFVEQVVQDPSHPDTRLLVGSVPVPNPDHPWTGEEAATFSADKIGAEACKFVNRCPMAMEKCLQQTPPLYQTDPHRAVACFLYEEAPVLSNADMDKVFRNNTPVPAP